jgi:PAS domain S-box-containing protein
MVKKTKPKKTSPSAEPRKISKRTSSDQRLSDIRVAAAQAQAAYQWEKALPLYSQALEVARRGKQPVSRSVLQTEYDLLDGQAECHRNLGDFAAESDALKTMVELACQLEDPARQARALVRRTVTAIRLGNLSNSQQLAESALKLARQSLNLTEATRRKLEADSLFHLGDTHTRLGDYPQAKAMEEQALERYRKLGDQAGEANTLWGLGFVEVRSGQIDQTYELFNRSLELFRRVGDREGMGNALNGLAIITNDLALARTYLEQALLAFEAIRNRERQTMIHNNLSWGYQALGLYDRARLELEPLVEITRQMQARGNLAYYLDNLAVTLLELGEYERARQAAQEALELARKSGERKMIAGVQEDLARIQLGSGNPDEAVQLFLKAVEEAEALDIPEQASGLAWLSATYLAQGNFELAFQATSQALTCLRAHGNTTGETPLNEFWWWRYQVLSALTPQPPLPNLGEGGEDLGELAWQALDQAREAMLARIASLSDDGLRRNYFNKVSINRQIIQEWLRVASERGLPLNPLTDHFSQPGDLQGQLQRMLDIGVRLNARRGTQDLPRFIMDEVVELTGADRAALYLMDEAGKRQLAAEVIPPSPQPSPQRGEGERRNEEQLLDETFLKRAPLLRYIPKNAPELEQRSVLCVPLIAQDRLVGLIDTELSGSYGRFTALDRDLLTVLANQAAVAVENTKWASSLEQRVEQRTTELNAANQALEQRAAELAIVNSVQQGLAAQLEMQAIFDLVGDKIRQIFDAQVVVIKTFNLTQRTIQIRYSYEKGQRFGTGDEMPFNKLIERLVQTRQPVLINRDADQQIIELGLTNIGDSESPKSMLFVPLVVGEQTKGMISLQNIDQEEAFGESDVRLLTTLANSMSVALENARLFDETKRLLVETEQRNNELAILNSVGEAMSKTLDVKTVTRIVGDKVRDIFSVDIVSILLLDTQTNLIHSQYDYDEKEGGYIDYIEPFLLGKGLTSKVISSRQPLLLDTAEEQLTSGGFLTREQIEIGGNQINPSWLGVPILASNRVLGVVVLGDYREHAFNENHVRLLQTLSTNMGVAIENARLFQAEQQRVAELAIINSVQAALAAELNIQGIYDTVGDKIREIFHNRDLGIRVYDAKTGMIHFPYSYENGERITIESISLAEKGISAHVLRTRETVVINENIEQESEKYGSYILPGSQAEKSAIFVPLVVGDQARGLINLVDMEHEHAFSESDVRLLQTLVNSMSVALENARLFDETQRLLAETEQRASEMAALNEIGREISATLDLNTVLERIAAHAHKVLQAKDVVLRLLEPDGNMPAVVAIGKNAAQNQASPMRLGQGITGHVAQTGIAEVVNDPARDPRVHHVPGTDREEDKDEAIIFAPLKVREKVIGVMAVWRSKSLNGPFSEADFNFGIGLALQAAIAIESARLFMETERRSSQMATIAEVGRELSATLDLQQVYESVASHVHSLFNARDTVLWLVEPDGKNMQTAVAMGKYPEQFTADIIPIGEGITGGIAQSGIAEVINDVASDPRAVHIGGTPDKEVEPETLMVAPLIVQGRTIGVLSVYHNQREGRFTQVDLDFLVGLGRQAAIAIENARLFAEVQRQKQFSESLVQNSPVAIVTADNQYIVTSWNQGAERLFGYCVNEAIGRDLNQLVAYQADLYAEAVAFDAQTSGGEPVHGITRRCRKDGSLVDVELSGVPVIVDGKQTGVIAIYHDITELKRAEAEILESQRRLASIIDFLPDATLVIDKQGNVIAWNRAIEEMTGVKADDMLGKGNYEYAIPFYGVRQPILVDLVFQPKAELERNYASIQRQGEVLIGETYVSRLKGGGHYLFATASVLHDSKGQVAGAIEVIRDITERKQAEVELQKAKAAAESANQAKSAFLAMMSHEIRTPMNAIIGMSGLLMDTPLNAEQRDFAETIRNSGDALLTIINDILDFSKIDAGKMELEEQPFDLRECLEASMDLIRLRASEKGLELAYVMEPDVPPAIVGDVTRLRQILINLLNNAVKFTEQGEVVLTLSSEPVRGDASHKATDGGKPESYNLHFSVRDTGIGIPPDRLERLFQAFSQADASTSRRYGGTGLGLAISKRLSELMGGKMWVESDGIPGKGSTFHFNLIAQAATDFQARSHLIGEQPQLRGKRLLIVDDNATNRRILTLQTKNWGMLPRDTAEPSEALAWLQRGDPFDLGILDLQMPGMDGPGLAAEIRKLRDEKSLPLVLSSSIGIRDTGMAPGSFTGFLLKPIRPSALFDTLITVLAAGTAKSEEAVPAAPQMDSEMASNHPLHILVAEDNVVNQKLALRLLSQMGYRADVAANGLEAIRSLERQPYDVILMDVQMPEMDGLEASRQICARWPRDLRPRIIAMTANAMQGDREMCLEAGMDDYISKPVRVNELVSALKKATPIKKGNAGYDNPRNLE